MKIALIHESDFIEGRWRRFDLMYKYLKALNNEVKIFAFSRRETNREDVVDIRVTPLTRMVGTAIHFLTFKLISNPSYLIKVCFELRKIEPDIVIFHHYDLGLFLLAFKQILFKNTKLVYDLNDLRIRMGYYNQRETPLFKFFAWIEEVFISRHVDGIIVPTNFGKSYLAGRGIDSKKIFILNELVDLESFHDAAAQKRRYETFTDPTKEKKLIWHGFIRHYQVDGIAGVIKAISIVQEKIPKIKLLIVGPSQHPEFMEKLILLAQRLNIDVEFTGKVQSLQMPMILNTAHVGIQPLPKALFTRFINGVKLSEYICSGLPVLCSNLEGPAELIRGNGLLFDPKDIRDLADKIIKIFESDYEELMDNSNKIAVEEFSHTAIEKKISDLVKFLGIRGDL
jgi:glycosyltransferase involved in cell wall biosynthesis